MPNYDPFVGFTYNGKHSIDDLHIYRTSNSNRYTDNLTATMTDKTVDVPGGNGQYYFGTTYKNKTFTVNYAFDGLTKAELNNLRETFSGDGIHDLVFDEDRNTGGSALKTWSAKVTGTAQIKYLCFEEEGTEVYKGEGSITFTCYCPFARGPKVSKEYSGSTVSGFLTIGGQVPTTFKVTCTSLTSRKIKIGPLEVTASQSSFIWDSKTGLVTDSNGYPISYTGSGYGSVGPGQVKIDFINNAASVKIEYYELYY